MVSIATLLGLLAPDPSPSFSTTDPEPVAVAGTGTGSPITSAISTARAERVALGVALSIPAVRKAQHVIAGTLGTFDLAGWNADGDRLAATDSRTAWLAQPDPARSSQYTITRTTEDLIWQDRAVWRIRDRSLPSMLPVAAERIRPSRIDTITHPLDPDTVETWIIDGAEVAPSELIVFEAAGLGGLERYGWDLLTLYGQLQAAAGRYAVAPHPHAILKNHGADLTEPEIVALLDKWEAARATRSVGYLNEVVDYETQGWNARELQLTEAREHAALEVARLFGLPARSLDAKSGDSMTYANVVDQRKDEVSALRPWMRVFESTLSIQPRRGLHPNAIRGVVPTGVRVTLDPSDYLREDTQTRMTNWNLALERGVLTLDEVRANEPLAGSN